MRALGASGYVRATVPPPEGVSGCSLGGSFVGGGKAALTLPKSTGVEVSTGGAGGGVVATSCFFSPGQASAQTSSGTRAKRFIVFPLREERLGCSYIHAPSQCLGRRRVPVQMSHELLHASEVSSKDLADLSGRQRLFSA